LHALAISYPLSRRLNAYLLTPRTLLWRQSADGRRLMVG
jgi:hypothetical protein